MKVYCYYDNPNPEEYPHELIERWAASFAIHGFEPEVLRRQDAEKHERYAEISELIAKFPTINGHEFEDPCWIRWLAYDRKSPALFTDYDVLNVSLLPKDVPVGWMTHLGGHMVYSRHSAIAQFVDFFHHALDHVREINGKPHIADQLLYDVWVDDRFGSKPPLCANVGDPDWQYAPCIHFCNGRLPTQFWFKNRYKLMDQFLLHRAARGI